VLIGYDLTTSLPRKVDADGGN